MKWDKTISNEFLVTKPKGTILEFTHYINERKEKQYPRMYYAGSPMHEVGDIIFQEFKDGPKIKLPVCTVSDLVPGQLIDIYYCTGPYKSEQFDLFLFGLDYGIKVFKNTYSNNFIICIDTDSEKKIEIDSTIPSWVYVKDCR